MIYLTSFFRSKELPKKIERWSAAVYQPQGFHYPKANCFDIRNEQGMWIRPREFAKRSYPLIHYRKTLLEQYQRRRGRILEWLGEAEGKHVALCCWCPEDKAAQRQLKEWGSFVCHLAVVGEYLATHTEETVWYDSDRLKMAVLTQKD